jgi:hypothetical protein
MHQGCRRDKGRGRGSVREDTRGRCRGCKGEYRCSEGRGGEGAHPMGDFRDEGSVSSSRGVIVGEGVVVPGSEP